MRKSLFNGESAFWRVLGVFGEILVLSLLWCLCSLPVVTLGGATAALYDTVVHSLRRREEDIFTRYWRTLKAEALPAIPGSIVWAGLLVGGFFLYRSYTDGADATQSTSFILAIALLALWIMLLGVACWVAPIRSRFTFSPLAMSVTGVKLALSHPLRTAALGLITGAAIWLSYQYILPIMVLPALTALAWSRFLESVFAKYM